jgi:flavin-dependent dehydrogenase
MLRDSFRERSERMSHDFDVIVAGGGPAGSSTANHLRQRGRSVLLLEREHFPRFHIGESLLPFGNDVWRELGVYEKMEAHFIRKPGALFVHEESGAQFTYYFDSAIRGGRPYAFQVKRAEFDQMLLDHAASLGAEVRQGTAVKNVDVAADGVTVTAAGPGGASLSARARLFVDATGRDALTATRQQLKVPDEVITTNVAVNTHYRDVERMHGEDEGNIIIGLFDGGWYWVIPFKGRDTSVGIVLERSYTRANRGAKPEQLFDQVLAQSTPFLRGILAKATRILAVGTDSNWSYRSRRFFAERTVLVGDAAAFVDPLFSTGVLFAVKGAGFAAAAIDRALRTQDFSSAQFEEYQRQCVAGMDLFKGLVHEFYGENLRKLLVASAHSATICSVIVSVLAGDVYEPSMWHSIVKEKGFSQRQGFDALPHGVRSSRDLASPRT